jgi:mannose-6-phosphate isomerase-like protein (cupin superfamily)
MPMDRIDIAEKLSRFSDHWSPKIVAAVDGYEVKLVKIAGDFIWHSHADADELFFVVKGAFRMDFRDCQVEVGEGQLIVVPRGVEHKPYAERECVLMLLERKGLLNTGDVVNERTHANPERI